MHASTGQRVDHVVNDVIALFGLVPADRVENARSFIEDYTTVYRRIQDRRLDAEELLELVFSSKFIGAVRDHIVLGPYALLSNREDPRKNVEELRDEWLRLLGMDEIAVKKSEGVVTANMVRRGMVRAHMANVDTSLLRSDCHAYANVATVKRQRKRPLPPTAAKLDVELCFNYMGDHLIKECRASRSVCPVKGCGEHHHVEAHKLIANRRLKRKMRMGSANRYPVKNSAGDGIAARLLQSEIDRFSDQCILWQRDVVDQEHDRSAMAKKTEESSVEESNDDEEAHADMTFLGDDMHFGLTAAVDGAINSVETDEDAMPVDGELADSPQPPVRCWSHPPLSDADSHQLLSLSVPVPVTPRPCCASWSNPFTWLGTSLIFIGYMLGGSHAAITLDGASIVSGDLASARNGLRIADRFVGSCSQGSERGAAPFDVSRSLLSASFSNVSGPVGPFCQGSARKEVSSPVSLCCQGSAWEEVPSLEGVDVRPKTRKTNKLEDTHVDETRSSGNNLVEGHRRRDRARRI